MTIFDLKMTELKSQFDHFFQSTIENHYNLGGSLHPAIQYALQAGGKRVRPLLCMLVTEALKGSVGKALWPALALEMVHTYSLVHDDLPCMDNDDFRRGKPTTHKIYGDATALLVGDALLTDAFQFLVHPDSGLSPEQCLGMVGELSRASGASQKGMVWGQSQDLYWTGRSGGNINDLNGIHLSKTGALLGASAALGAYCATLDRSVIAGFRQFGMNIGLAFQIIDDLLDESALTGKSQGKDKETNKLTYVALLGEVQARNEATRLTDEAKELVRVHSDNFKSLFEFTDHLLSRTM